MSHYEAQREEHVKRLEEAFGKRAHVTPGQKGAYLCPPGTYLEGDGMPKPLKETAGKAEGARFCFLPDIAKLMSEDYNTLGELLSLIVSGVETNNKTQAMYYCTQVLEELADEHTMNDLIGVRAQALSSGKYTFESYREKIDVNLLLDAAARHFLKILFVSNTDEESGFPHTAHLAANVIMIHTQLELHHA